MGHRLWLPAVAIHRLGIVEIAPSPHRCFRTANPCAQSVNSSPAEPVLSRSSRQRLGHLQSQFDRGWHVCQAVLPELQPAAACRRVELRLSYTSITTRLSYTSITTRLSCTSITTRLSCTSITTRLSCTSITTRLSCTSITTRLSYTSITTRLSCTSTTTRLSYTSITTRLSYTSITTRLSYTSITTSTTRLSYTSIKKGALTSSWLGAPTHRTATTRITMVVGWCVRERVCVRVCVCACVRACVHDVFAIYDNNILPG